MSRLSKELEQAIRKGVKEAPHLAHNLGVDELLNEITELRRERDEAIAGAYRAAAEESLVSSPMNGLLAKRILALTPQSALDAVERREREIADEGLRVGAAYGVADIKWAARMDGSEEPKRPTADDVLAKVGRRQ